MRARAQRILLFPLTRLVIAGLALVTLIALGALASAASGVRIPALVWTLILLGIALLVHLLVGIRLERRTSAELGLGREGAGRDMLVGTGLGVLLMAVIVGSLALPGWYTVAGGEAVWLGFAGSLLLLLFAAGFEELVFRGMIFRILEEWLGSCVALLASGLLFGLVHIANPGSSLLAALAIALEAGVLLGAAYMLTRSLWLAWGIHWGWNLAQGPIFGLPVSGLEFDGLLNGRADGPASWTGGAFGPEAGLAATLVSVPASLLCLWLAWRRGRFVPRRWARGQEQGARSEERGAG